jgi:hypothetical protein
MADEKVLHEVRVVETEDGFRIEIKGDKERLKEMFSKGFPFGGLGRMMMGGFPFGGRHGHHGRHEHHHGPFGWGRRGGWGGPWGGWEEEERSEGDKEKRSV